MTFFRLGGRGVKIFTSFMTVLRVCYERWNKGSSKGGLPLSRNFYVRTDVNFNWLYVRKLK